MKRFELIDYRPPNLRVLPVAVVFVDLDETLVHSVGRPKSRRQQFRVTALDGKLEGYSSLLRPGALEFLAGLRAAVPSVRLLTNGTRPYALAVNHLYGLGFVETDIIAREDYTVEVNREEYPVALASYPGSLLIDNEAPTMRRASMKRSFLGSVLYIQVREFTGREDPFPVLDEVLRAVQLAVKPAA